MVVHCDYRKTAGNDSAAIADPKDEMTQVSAPVIYGAADDGTVLNSIECCNTDGNNPFNRVAVASESVCLFH